MAAVGSARRYESDRREGRGDGLGGGTRWRWKSNKGVKIETCRSLEDTKQEICFLFVNWLHFLFLLSFVLTFKYRSILFLVYISAESLGIKNLGTKFEVRVQKSIRRGRVASVDQSERKEQGSLGSDWSVKRYLILIVIPKDFRTQIPSGRNFESEAVFILITSNHT